MHYGLDIYFKLIGTIHKKTGTSLIVKMPSEFFDLFYTTYTVRKGLIGLTNHQLGRKKTLTDGSFTLYFFHKKSHSFPL